jgi:hypothetical protein
VAIHDDLVRGERDERAPRHRIVGHEHGHLRRVAAERVGDLLRRQHESARRVQDEVDWGLVGCRPDGAQHGLGVVDVDEAVDRHAE